MNGTVHYLGREGTRAAILLDGGYFVFDVREPGEAERGDKFSGLERARGRQHVQNRTQGRTVEVFVAAFDANPELLAEMLRRES
jgi:hypothetical protein